MRRTVQLWHEYDLIGFNEDGSSHLHTILCIIVALDDFDLARAVVSVSPDSYIRHKQALLYSLPPLGVALEKCGHNSAWRDTIDDLAGCYTVEELETPCGEHNSFMGDAISSDSMIGVEALLKKGLNACTSNLTLMMLLHHCLTTQASPEMMSLLVQYGADMLAQETSL